MTKKHLLFLHGALGCKEHWERFIPAFEESHEIHNLDFPSHGKSSELLNDNDYSSLTQFVRNYVTANRITDFSIVGYSMGGYIGLDLLKQGIEGCRHLVMLSTKMNWNNEIAGQECDKLTTENLSPILEKLQKEHGENYDHLLTLTRDILRSIGANPLRKYQFELNKIPVTMLLGSKDRMIPREEITAFISGMPFVKFEIVEDQPHLLEKMDTAVIQKAIAGALNESE